MMLRKNVLKTDSLLSRLFRCFAGSRLVFLYLAPASFDIHVESKYVKLLLDLEDFHRSSQAFAVLYRQMPSMSGLKVQS